jgi:hypothetical protein
MPARPNLSTRPHPVTADTTDTNEGADDDQAHDDQAHDDDDQQHGDDDGKTDRQIGREAARYRRRLRSTQQRLESASATISGLQDTLARQRQAIVNSALENVGLHPDLLAAAGHTMDSLLDDDGLLHWSRVSEAINATIVKFDVTPRRAVKPNPQQGKPSCEPPTATWSRLLGDARNR